MTGILIHERTCTNARPEKKARVGGRSDVGEYLLGILHAPIRQAHGQKVPSVGRGVRFGSDQDGELQALWKTLPCHVDNVLRESVVNIDHAQRGPPDNVRTAKGDHGSILTAVPSRKRGRSDIALRRGRQREEVEKFRMRVAICTIMNQAQGCNRPQGFQGRQVQRSERDNWVKPNLPHKPVVGAVQTCQDGSRGMGDRRRRRLIVRDELGLEQFDQCATGVEGSRAQKRPEGQTSFNGDVVHSVTHAQLGVVVSVKETGSVPVPPRAVEHHNFFVVAIRNCLAGFAPGLQSMLARRHVR